MAFVILFYLLKVAIYFLLRIYHCLTCNMILCKQTKSLQRSLKKSLFFTELHGIYIEGFMEIAISIILTLREDIRSPFGEYLAYLLAWFSLLVILVQLPFSYFMVFCHQKQVFDEDERFATTYSALVDGIRQDTTMQRIYYAILLLRRTLYLVITLLMPFLPTTFQIFALFYKFTISFVQWPCGSSGSSHGPKNRIVQ